MSNFLKLGVTLVISLIIANFISLKWSTAHYEDQYAEAIKKQEEHIKKQRESMEARIYSQEMGVNSKANVYNQAVKARNHYQKNTKDTWQSTWQNDSNHNQQSRVEKEQQRKLASEKKQHERAKLTINRKRQAENLQAVRAQNDKTCNYWRNEYHKNNTFDNKKHLTNACNRAEND